MFSKLKSFGSSNKVCGVHEQDGIHSSLGRAYIGCVLDQDHSSWGDRWILEGVTPCVNLTLTLLSNVGPRPNPEPELEGRWSYSRHHHCVVQYSLEAEVNTTSMSIELGQG